MTAYEYIKTLDIDELALFLGMLTDGDYEDFREILDEDVESLTQSEQLTQGAWEEVTSLIRQYTGGVLWKCKHCGNTTLFPTDTCDNCGRTMYTKPVS